MLLYNPALIYTCPEVFTFQYTFSPNSDVASVQPSGGLKSITGPVNETSVLQGYWTGSGQNYTFHTFSQGTYTVVVFDAWKQSAIGYFQVGSGTVTSPGNISLLADCPTSGQVNVPWFGTIVAKTSSPAVICVQLYEFNSTSLITLNTTKLISIQGSQPIHGGGRGSVNGAGNFTVVVSQSQVVLGGPTNAGEGTLVAFAITAKPGASGTYSIALGGFELGSEPESCGSNGELVAGNGQPNYALIGDCITYSTTSAQQPFTIPGVSYNLLSNNLYFRIASITNSTL